MERINEPSEPHSELCKIPSYLKNKKRPETSKILLLFYNTVNSTILYCLQFPDARVFEA